MQIVELKELELPYDFFPKRREGADPIRTQGVHLTDIIRDIMESSGMSKTISGASWGRDQLNMAAEIGFLWEDVLEMALKERLPCRIGEIEVDGITMSPDGIEEYEGEAILSEYKLVWSSSNRNPADNWKWMAQTKGYCYGLGLRRVRMYNLYLNGDWRGTGPKPKGFLIDFTDLEIQENWEMIVGHARRKGWIK